jgi:hypothetical protein
MLPLVDGVDGVELPLSGHPETGRPFLDHATKESRAALTIIKTARYLRVEQRNSLQRAAEALRSIDQSDDAFSPAETSS